MIGKIVNGIVTAILNVFIGSAKQKKLEERASQADARMETIRSMREAKAVERQILSGQKSVDRTPTNIVEEDNGLNFDDFNKGM